MSRAYRLSRASRNAGWAPARRRIGKAMGKTVGKFLRSSAAAASSQVEAGLRDNSGNVALIFAFAMLPLLAFAGAAVDYSSAVTTRAQAQRLADAAVLAAAQRMAETNADLDTIRNDMAAYLQDRLPPRVSINDLTISFPSEHRGAELTLNFSTPTTILSVLGREVMNQSILAQARAAVDIAEIAVALDVTGSMRTHVPAMRQATRELIEELKPASSNNDNVRVSLVPYVTTVNVSGHPSHMNWMDVSGQALHHGENFAGTRIQDNRCFSPPPPPPPPPPQAASNRRPRPDTAKVRTNPIRRRFMVNAHSGKLEAFLQADTGHTRTIAPRSELEGSVTNGPCTVCSIPYTVGRASAFMTEPRRYHNRPPGCSAIRYATTPDPCSPQTDHTDLWRHPVRGRRGRKRIDRERILYPADRETGRDHWSGISASSAHPACRKAPPGDPSASPPHALPRGRRSCGWRPCG